MKPFQDRFENSTQDSHDLFPRLKAIICLPSDLQQTTNLRAGPGYFAGAAASSADTLEDLKKIDVAISGQQLEYTIRKNSLTAQGLQQALDSKSRPEAVQPSKKSKARICLPQNVVNPRKSSFSGAK